MRIVVEYLVDGKEKTIEVNNVHPNFDSIKVLKFKIGLFAAEQGINIVPPPERQRLLWNGKIVNENGHQTLSDHGIKEESWGPSSRLRLEPRRLLVEECHYYRDYTRGRTVFTSFIVDPTCETVDSIKQKIQLLAKKKNIQLASPKCQQLFHVNQELLEGHRMLSEYNIEADSTLQFFTALYQIYFKNF